MTININRIQSDALEVDNTDDQDSVLDDSDTATDDNNEHHFREERE